MPLDRQPELIAGLDCALTKDSQGIIAAAVVVRNPQLQKGLWGTLGEADFELVEKTTASRKLNFPYIPGLLSFREAPACIEAIERLKTEPDLFIIDGQGFAHPRRLGLASHLGLFFDKPTIGCAKSRLTGTFQGPPPEKGAHAELRDNNETIGAVLTTRNNVKPLFVSVGNKCTLEDAVKITLSCCTKYRLPEPTRLAHRLVSEAKRKA
jgi:deoxyribonuclease V